MSRGLKAPASLPPLAMWVLLLSLAGPSLAAEEAAPSAQAEVPAQAEATEKPRLLVLDLKNDGVDEGELATLNGLLTVLFAEEPTFDVISGEDLKRLLDLEAERQAMDCSDASCLAEISDAMGAEYVVFGSAGPLGTVHVINLNLYDSQTARPLSRTSVHVESLAQSSDILRTPVKRLVDVARRTRAGEKVESGFVERADRPLSPVALMGVGMGLAFAGGVGTTVVALTPWLLTSTSVAPKEAAYQVQDARDAQLVSGGPEELNWLAVTQWTLGISGVAVAGLGSLAAGYGAYTLTVEDEE